jgi:glyoxylate utilization-related uncharacterized protein
MEPAGVTSVAGLAAIGPGWAVLPLHVVAPVSLPEWTDAECRILASPALGARMTHHHVALRANGGARGELAPHLEGWCWVLDGELRFDLNGLGHRLARGSFVYLPPGARYGVEVPGDGAELLLHVRAFEPLAGHEPDPVVENPVRLPAAPGARALLPELPAWDVAVTVTARAAGERGDEIVHAFEQALWVLDGEGTIALAGRELPLRPATFVWLGAFQPHAIHATEAPLRWIESRGANRDVTP